MTDSASPTLQAGSLSRRIAEAAGKAGKVVLSDEELLLLAANALSRTYTFEETGYTQPEE